MSWQSRLLEVKAANLLSPKNTTTELQREAFALEKRFFVVISYLLFHFFELKGPFIKTKFRQRLWKSSSNRI